MATPVHQGDSTAKQRKGVVEQRALLDEADSSSVDDSPPPESSHSMDMEASLGEGSVRARAGVRQYATFVGMGIIALLFVSYVTTPAKAIRPPPNEPFSETLKHAGRRALGGGLSGAFAGVMQVLLLMWLRTTMNYQYRYGTSARATMKILYAEGGVRRFYQGLPWALLQTPLTRFGDTASNTGILILLGSTRLGASLPMTVRQVVVSIVAAGWRMALTPIDTCKTTMQVQGASGYAQLRGRIRAGGLPVLWAGALGNAVANFVGNYPWYLTYNTLDEAWRLPADVPPAPRLVRLALLGFCAACVSDCCSNSIRVLKTTRQTSERPVTYAEAVRLVLEKDGWPGLLGRGLGTRLLTNGIQASLFTVMWKLGEQYLSGRGFS